KYVDGSLHLSNGRTIVFNAYNRKPRRRSKDTLLKKLPWGWVKESSGRIKVHHSFPKSMTTAELIINLDHETSEAKDVLVCRELDIIEYC
ncbi:MAG: hypothetical protein J6X23_05540, partial [Bacteroidaceae bacterium]|nr:hypothetical protein [Bacteroidaceae bacterium]